MNALIYNINILCEDPKIFIIDFSWITCQIVGLII